MARTRTAVLAGALRAVEVSGSRRATMADVAVHGGVAKATVYNHFRTKADVYEALVESEVAALGRECAERADGAAAAPDSRDPLATAVEHAATRLSEHRALRRLAADEPEVLARLLQPDGGPAWEEARAAAGRVLAAAGRDADAPAVDAVLRAVVSHLTWPADRSSAARTADVLARGLRLSGPVSPAGPPSPDGRDPDRDGGPHPDPGTAAPAAPSPPAGAGEQRPDGEPPGESGLGWPG